MNRLICFASLSFVTLNCAESSFNICWDLFISNGSGSLSGFAGCGTALSFSCCILICCTFLSPSALVFICGVCLTLSGFNSICVVNLSFSGSDGFLVEVPSFSSRTLTARSIFFNASTSVLYIKSYTTSFFENLSSIFWG